MSLGRIDTTVDEKVESVCEPGSDGCRAEQFGARRRELYGEGKTVECDADSRNVGGSSIIELEVWSNRLCTLIRDSVYYLVVLLSRLTRLILQLLRCVFGVDLQSV